MKTFAIKDYLVLSLLGQGGMAKVYLAEHKSLGHKVAIKVLNKEYFHNDNIRKRFLAEARSLAQMNHPNIVRVMDLIEDNESAAFVMEHIEGRTLRDYLEEKGKLPDDEIKHLFGQMLDAVGYVHEKGLIHRDIKPSNFMLDGRGNIKLLDFGIAKAHDSSAAEYTQTGTGVQMGTPMYMSPEQIVSTKAVTTQSDIYSMGVVLWQMVSGKKPYDSSILSTFQIQAKIVNEPLPETGTVWGEIIYKATRKDLKTRYKKCSAIFVIKRRRTNKEIVNLSNDHTYDSNTIIENPSRITNKLKESTQIRSIEDDDKTIYQQLKKMNKDDLVNFDKIMSARKEGKLGIEILDSPENLFNAPTNIYTVLSHVLLISIYSLLFLILNIDFDRFWNSRPNNPFNDFTVINISKWLGLAFLLIIHRLFAELIYPPKKQYQYFYSRNQKFVDSVISVLLKL
jgi:serine/threonine protein kinase